MIVRLLESYSRVMFLTSRKASSISSVVSVSIHVEFSSNVSITVVKAASQSSASLFWTQSFADASLLHSFFHCLDLQYLHFIVSDETSLSSFFRHT